MLSAEFFFVNCKLLKYWIKKKTFFAMLVQKKPFSGAKFDPKPTKKKIPDIKHEITL